MRKKRMTVGEAQMARALATQEARERFMLKLRACTTYVEAKKLTLNCPAPDTPARKFYTNLMFFMDNMSAPDGADREELEEYLRLLKCFKEEGALKEGVYERYEPGLSESVKKRRY